MQEFAYLPVGKSFGALYSPSLQAKGSKIRHKGSVFGEKQAWKYFP